MYSIVILEHSDTNVISLEMSIMVVIVWQLDLHLPIQSVPITTKVVSSNPTQAIQHYVIKFVSDLRQVGGFLRVLFLDQ
jgi:hypothetical protein